MKARSLVWSATAVSALAMSSFAFTGAAQAVPPSDARVDTITFVGSDTTQFFDEQFCEDINANAYGDNPSVAGAAKDFCSNIYAFNTTTAASTEVSPADAVSAACTWSVTPKSATALVDTTPCDGAASTTDAAPTGSGAGNTRLLASLTSGTSAAKGVVDVGRASSDQCTGKGVLTETCFAYGRDAVGIGEYRATSFPLTVQEIKDIYSCAITNFNQIPNAGSGVIKRYFPQNGSGTGSFFVTNFLGGVDPRVTLGACPTLATQVPENDATAIPSASRAASVLPFSAGSFIAQKVDQPGVEVPDTIGSTGFQLAPVKLTADSAQVNPILNPATANPTPNPAAYGETATYPGARYIYHDVDSRSTQFNAAVHFVGTTTAGTPQRSKLCANTSAINTRLKQYGFLPLPVQSGVNGTCRVFSGS